MIEYWGPYCKVPRVHDGYVMIVYPFASGAYIDQQGEVREMTAEELAPFNEQYDRQLERSFMRSKL